MQTSHTFTLENGLRVIYIPKPQSTIFTLRAFINSGASMDDAGGFPSGTSHFVEHMLFHGSAKYPSKSELTNLVLHKGAFINGFTSYMYQHYFVTMRSEFLTTGLEYFSQLLFQSKLDKNLIENERSVILSELEKNESDPDKFFTVRGQISNSFKNPFAQKYALGDKEGISSISYEDISKFYSAYFAPENTVLYICGDFDVEVLKTKFNNYFATNSTPRPAQVPINTIRNDTVGDTILHFAGIKNAKIACNIVIDIDSSQRITELRLLSRLLSGGMNSRLIKELREKRGLVYYVSPFQFQSKNQFLFGITTESNSENINAIKNCITEEISKIATELVSDIDLDQEKNRLVLLFEKHFESTEDICEKFMLHEFYFGEILDKDTAIQEIQSITPTHIQKAAQDLVATGLNWVIMTPE